MGGAVTEVEREPGVGPLHFLDRRLDADAHEGPVGSRLEAVDDGTRVVCHREHATILLGLGADPAFGEPCDGIPRLEAVKCPEELTPPAWVFFY